ncbi:MAG: hypothetical protein WDN49_25905 [Acetobacteraceae bacterium]
MGDVPLRFHVYSRGRIRQTAGLVDTAAWLARRERSPSIRMEHLAKAVLLNRKGAAALQPNPFQVGEIRPAAHVPFEVVNEDDRE